MAEWVSVPDAAAISQYHESSIYGMIKRGEIPADQWRIWRGRKQTHVNAVADLQSREKKSYNDCDTEPIDAVHVADPLSMYIGFDLAPDAARRLIAIRRNKRVYGDTWACNRQLVNALQTVREYIGDG